MKFTDTRTGVENDLTFTDVVVKGIAPSGGLFVPTHIPSMTDEDIRALADMPYGKQAATVFKHFGIDVDDATIDEAMCEAYGSQWSDERIVPVTTLREGVHILELFHGPTSAFKDLALQCMPRFMSISLAQLYQKQVFNQDMLILVATSGDTGKAALDGFADRAHTSIVVFYPEEGVSDLQKMQMATQMGDNVAVFGVRGNFDDCQSAVKAAFADDTFNDWLGAHAKMKLSSANSINWGRLMPQIVYYLSACARLWIDGKLAEGQLLDISVPTGNFGNILAAWYAKQMGAPIGRLICASNSNNILADFLRTGIYDISDRSFFTTPSPSMDILISSNLERLLYHLAGAEKTALWMEQLKTKESFEVDDDTFDLLQETFVGGWIGDDESLDRIFRCWKKHHYLIDPHTAVGLDIALLEQGDNPILVVSTAHWAKFAPSVLRALLGVSFDDEMPEPYTSHSGFETLDDVIARAPGCSPIPEAIEALRDEQPRFKEVIDADPEAIKQVIKAFVAD